MLLFLMLSVPYIATFYKTTIKLFGMLEAYYLGIIKTSYL